MKRVVLIATLLVLPACASAQEETPRPEPHEGAHPMMPGADFEQMMQRARTMRQRIDVSATGYAQRAPEQAVVRLAVETVGETARAAAASNAERMDDIIDALTDDLDIPRDQIQTVAYRMYPEYAREEGRREPEIIGYRVTNVLSVTVDGPERAGAVIDASLAAGANRVEGLSFQLRDVDSARAEALRNAMRKAREEARILAEAAGLNLGEPIVISTSTSGPVPPPMPMYARAEAAAMDVATPVEPGQLEVRATVSVQYAIRP